MTFNLSLFLHEVLYTAYLLASWLCLTWLIRFVELVCCALFSSFCFELYNSFNTSALVQCQIGISALHGGFLPAHISCQPQLQPCNSCRLSISAAQNSSSNEILYVILYS